MSRLQVQRLRRKIDMGTNVRATCCKLQEAVVEMKSAFVQALQQLGSLEVEEREAREHQEKARADTERQLAEALKLLIAFKTELGSTQQTVRVLQERTRQLERSGFFFFLLRPHPPTAPGSSGAPSSDSGVALLLERAHAAFSAPTPAPAPAASSVISTLVQDYVAALGGEFAAGLSGDEDDDETGLVRGTKPDDDLHYDSECSLSLAAAKSLSLSTSLGQQCGLELEAGESGSCSDEATTNVASCTSVTTGDTAQQAWRDAQRLEVVRELLAAEQSYCQTLQTMHDAFAEPLRASGILAATDLNTLFPEEVWQLRTEHGALLSGLRTRVANWGPGTKLGDLLQRLLADVLRLYTSYANAFPEVLQTFHRLCRASPAFTRFLKSCLQRPACAGVDLGALLLTPVQHMPRYVLLLRQLLHVTPQECEDHATIAACLARLRDFLARLNDSMEHSFQLVAAQMGAPRDPQSGGRSQKTNRRSSSHHRSAPREVPCVSSRREARRDVDCSRRRTQQRTQSARPGTSRRSNSDWALQQSHGEPAHSDMMLSSSEELGSASASHCDTNPAGFSAISEPSLAEAAVGSAKKAPTVTSCTRPLSSAHSVHNVSKNVTYVARTFWSSESRCDLESSSPDKSSNSEKPKKKKRSLRASLKNILSFRKRCVQSSAGAVMSIEQAPAVPCMTVQQQANPEVERSLKGLVQQLGRMPGYIELVVYCLRETAV
ncbi:hypothetical protein B566_EDAN000908 [Ephemera danica]|nr:hypothetical protein B566_EDAN000908 [Ephemera danica]